MMSEQHHDQKEEHAQESQNAEYWEPDLVALVVHADVDWHLVGPRRKGILEAQHEQRDEDQQITGRGTKGVKIGEKVDRGALARLARGKEGDDRLQEGDPAKDQHGPRRRPEALVHLREPGGEQVELTHRVTETR